MDGVRKGEAMGGSGKRGRRGASNEGSTLKRLAAGREGEGRAGKTAGATLLN